MQAKTSLSRTVVLGDAVARHAEQPQPIVRWRRDLFELAPGNGEDVRDDVVGVSFCHAPPHVAGNLGVAGGVNALELGRAHVTASTARHVVLRGVRFMHPTWPASARIRGCAQEPVRSWSMISAQALSLALPVACRNSSA